MAAPRASLAYAMVEPTAKLMAAPTVGPTVGQGAKV